VRALARAVIAGRLIAGIVWWALADQRAEKPATESNRRCPWMAAPQAGYGRAP